MTRGTRIILCVLLGVALSATLAWFQTRHLQSPAQTIVGMPIGDHFEGLVDQNGKAVDAKTFADKYQLVFFGFTYCPAVCPTELARLSGVLKKLDDKQRAQLAVIFVSVDPDRDNPKMMKSYLSSFDPGITGLTGSVAATKKVTDDWKVYAAKVPAPDGGGYTVDHSAFLYFRNPKGGLLSLFQPGDSPKTILEAVQAQIAP